LVGSCGCYGLAEQCLPPFTEPESSLGLGTTQPNSHLPTCTAPTCTHLELCRPSHPTQLNLAEFGAARLGWNASSWAPAATAVATLSHPRGDVLKYSFSASGLQRASFQPARDGSSSSSVIGAGSSGVATHYKVCPWACQSSQPNEESTNRGPGDPSLPCVFLGCVPVVAVNTSQALMARRS